MLGPVVPTQILIISDLIFPPPFHPNLVQFSCREVQHSYIKKKWKQWVQLI